MQLTLFTVKVNIFLNKEQNSYRMKEMKGSLNLLFYKEFSLKEI